MTETYNIYCDESCHLEHDQHKAMVLGAVWCPLRRTRKTAERIRDFKVRHGLGPSFEIKFTKVSPAKLQFYMDVLDYFFDDDDLHFRALVVPDKSILQHKEFQQTHDDWYYKMYFTMLRTILDPEACHRIYLDVKDTRGALRIHKLHEVLCNDQYDFNREIIERVQLVRSHEVEQLQLADLLIGIVSYANRGLETSCAKLALVERMRKRSNYSLTRTTLYREDKVNILRWRSSVEFLT